MSIPEKISFRPGELAGPIAKKLLVTSETPSKYIRRLIAEDLDVDAPEMRGNVAYLKQYARPKKKRGGRRH